MNPKKLIVNILQRMLSLKFFEAYNYYLTDLLYTEARRKLYEGKLWKFGDIRLYEVAQDFIKHMDKHTGFSGKKYLELGCGKYNPFGNSVVMYLNGASQCIAFDLFPPDDKKRAAEALFDLLGNCALNPDKWIFSTISKTEFLNRISQFDTEALRLGNLDEGLKKVPIKHLLGNIDDINIPDNSIELVTSRSVLEHFLNFETAMKNLYRFCAKDSYIFHSIDLTDHRAYVKKKYNYWSFLNKPDNWTDNLCNRLRASEIKAIFEKTGFEILEWNTKKFKFPLEVRKKLKGRFKNMSDEELGIIEIKCVLRKN